MSEVLRVMRPWKCSDCVSAAEQFICRKDEVGVRDDRRPYSVPRNKVHVRTAIRIAVGRKTTSVLTPRDSWLCTLASNGADRSLYGAMRRAQSARSFGSQCLTNRVVKCF